ncbi:hypothetical protein PV396_23440 [Streptomyces sp. ME02-8801-2C]|uniref:hypothetical protein n=1 Tax=Streptomyces sp. ME02-8801-2C TaxID=3028680 RepID=UPI0029B8B134|nr:hypothetical protein [Streptomyces sp. ME02-8801-2C]MDX3454857.1 hypothetical protein [Streptomyces sp. ME02-8801-2C]
MDDGGPAAPDSSFAGPPAGAVAAGSGRRSSAAVPAPALSPFPADGATRVPSVAVTGAGAGSSARDQQTPPTARVTVRTTVRVRR